MSDHVPFDPSHAIRSAPPGPGVPLLLTVDPSLRQPLARQIREQLLGQLESGVLRAGETLPSTRHLAAQLAVHRSTVGGAYQELASLGWIDLRPGALPRVRARMPVAPARTRREEGFPWQEAFLPALQGLAVTAARPPKPGSLSFAALSVDPRLIPTEAFRTCLNRELRRKGAALLGYGAREGYFPLRAYLARRLGQVGITVGPEQILLTHGSQQALDLVFRALGTGRTVAVEAPTYDQVLPLLRIAGAESRGIPMTPEGMDLGAFEALCEEAPPALVYTMPNFQNPTGISTTQTHRERLLGLCHRFGVPILEDGFEEEMKYFGKVSLPLKSMDRNGSVLYCGTFSKVVFPGLRLGWLAAPEACIRTLAALRHASELCPSSVLQAAMHAFCETGHYDRHLNRMHRVFRRRMRVALDALDRHVSRAFAQWETPQGGYLLWLRLQEPAAGPEDWRALFEAHGVQVTFGDRCFPAQAPGTYVRLSISSLDEEEIEEGLRRLGTALTQGHDSQRPAPRRRSTR